VVAPLLHEYELPALAVRVTVPPTQNVVVPLAVMVGGAAAVIVSVTGVLVLLSQLVLVFLLAA
jgi:hypothetical protein